MSFEFSLAIFLKVPPPRVGIIRSKILNDRGDAGSFGRTVARDTAPALPSHALAYELGALCRLPYGISACLTLPACILWTAARDPRVLARQAEIARILQVVHPDKNDPGRVQ